MVGKGIGRPWRRRRRPSGPMVLPLGSVATARYVPAVASRFDQDTTVTVLADGTISARMDPGWWIERGPNGGYVAAVILRALSTKVDDANRSPRSFTVHYLAPPVEGPVQIEAAIERSGRLMTFVSGRVRQDGRLIATAQAAFAAPMPGIEFCDLM